MTEVTLSQYFKIKGYPNKDYKMTNFAKDVGLSNTYISKVYNNRSVSSTSASGWNKLAEYLAKDGFILKSGSNEDIMIEKNKSLIVELKKENMALKHENEQLKKESQMLKKLVKTCRKIVMTCDEIPSMTND